jgi:hypothetical protein
MKSITRHSLQMQLAPEQKIFLSEDAKIVHIAPNPDNLSGVYIWVEDLFGKHVEKVAHNFIGVSSGLLFPASYEHVGTIRMSDGEHYHICKEWRLNNDYNRGVMMRPERGWVL